MNNRTILSYSDSEMASKIKKRFVKYFHATFDKKKKINCISLIMDDEDQFKNRSKRPTFVLRLFLTMLNLEVERLSPQKLEYEMDCTDYPVDYNFFEIGYCGHPTYPYTNIQLEKAIDLILSHFQEEYHFFINDTLRNKNAFFPLILCL